MMLVLALLGVAIVAGLWASGRLPVPGTGITGTGDAALTNATLPLQIISAGQTHEFQVELADTDSTRAQGLMFRRVLAPDRGMLFDFGEPREVSMWMRNTYISLDMIFATPDGTITRIARRTTPHSEAQISSSGPVKFVLELAGGTAEKLKLVPGAKLRHPSIR
ncbi:MAG: DUF192 domain-containing protein [Alphaproteobacteria bacterium]